MNDHQLSMQLQRALTVVVVPPEHEHLLRERVWTPSSDSSWAKKRKEQVLNRLLRSVGSSPSAH